MTANPNPYRVCDRCHKIDKAPRHQLGLAGSPEERVTYTDELREELLDAAGGDREKMKAVMAHVSDTATRLLHLDCCVKEGCFECSARLDDPDDAFDGKLKDDKLVAAFMKAYEQKAAQ